jgi:hypothetical protein
VHDLEEGKFDMDNDIEKQKSHLNKKDREMEVLQKHFKYAKDREAVLMAERYVSLNSILCRNVSCTRRLQSCLV